MGGSLTLTLIAVQFVLAAIFIYLVLDHLFGFRYDPKEPPLVPQRIPYIGHLIGIIRHGPMYYYRIRYVYPFCSSHPGISSHTLPPRAKYPLPISTLAMLDGRTYAITHPDPVAAVQRSPQIFSFDPFVRAAARRLRGWSQPAIETVARHLDHGGLPNETKRDMHAALAPGPHLDAMNATMVGTVAVARGGLDAELDGRDLWGGESVPDGSEGRAWVLVRLRFSSSPIHRVDRLGASWVNCHSNTVRPRRSNPASRTSSTSAPSLIASNAYRGRDTVVRAFAAPR